MTHKLIQNVLVSGLKPKVKDFVFELPRMWASN